MGDFLRYSSNLEFLSSSNTRSLNFEEVKHVTKYSLLSSPSDGLICKVQVKFEEREMTYGRDEMVEIQWIFRINIGVYGETGDTRPSCWNSRGTVSRSWIRGLNGFRTVSVWPIQIPRMGLPCDIRIPYVAMPVPRCRMRFMSSAR